MNHEGDPEIQAALAEASARRSLWRTVLIWGPFFIAAFAALVFFLFDELNGGNRGSWFLVGLLAVFSLLLGLHAGQSLRDLAGQPAELTGFVVRRWSRTDSLVMRSHYIRVEGSIFHIDRIKHGDIEEGDYIWVRYYPHSATVVQVEKREPPETEEPEA
ncbi:MAG: hypothetical protein ACE5EF_04640 [Dehalococcoidia bacterium]